jgi:CheY-like chemotaxis protein
MGTGVPSATRRVVLLVEDDRSLRQLYRLDLELRGFTVAIAGDGLEALSLIEQRPTPDVVTLDLGLPRLGGLSVAGELAAHEETRSIPIVIVTGSSELINEAAFAAVLRKPVTPHELTMAVERALASRRGQKPATQP